MKTSHSVVVISLLLFALLPACSKKTPDTAWSDALTLSSGDNNSKPQIAINSAGRKLAVWQQIEYKEALDTATNTTHTGAANHGAHTHYDISARVHVWGAHTNSDGSTWSTAAILESSDWTLIRRVSRDNTTNAMISGDNIATVKQTAPRVAIDSQGNGLALWEMDNATSGVVELSWAKFQAGSGAWTVSSTPLDDASTADIRNPQLALGSSGIALAAWEQRDTTANNWVIYAKMYSSSGWDTTATRLSGLDTDGQALPAEQVRLAYSDVGIGMAVWRQLLKTAGTSNTDLQYAIYAKRFLLSGPAWDSSAVLISDGDGYDAKAPSLSINSAGTAWASWQQLDTTFVDPTHDITDVTSIWTNAFNATSGTWGTTPAVVTKTDLASTGEDESAQAAYDSSIAVNNVGDVLVAWLQKPNASTANALTNQWNTQPTRVWTAGYSAGWRASTPATSISDRYDASAPLVRAIDNTSMFVSWREGTTPSAGSTFIAHTLFYTVANDFTATDALPDLKTNSDGPLASSFAGGKLVMIWDNGDQAIQFSELK